MADLGVRFLGDPVAFLEQAGRYLDERPVTATVVATVAERWRRSGHAPGSPYDWFAVVEDDGEVVGAAMRTAAFEPHPIYVLDQPEDAARALARAVVERGEPVTSVNGLRPAVDVLAAEVARLRGGDPQVDLHMRLFELGTLRPPAEVATGRLRRVEDDDLDLAVDWFRRFHRDADKQAGRTAAHSAEGEGDEVVDDVRARIAIGTIWLWEDDGGPRHLTAANPPALGVVRIGPVFTPAEHRGRGYAASAVSQIAADQRAAGHRVVLFTDQANPVSNRLYLGLGFEAVVDTAHLALHRETGPL
ncbi:GNAT family N-acetyltransferase [Nocardioides sp.]|uniref:GNAT family N-acetyltransferase n=1 Tax=Nocardioides sp. TaxID=35761 RepID=UPI003514D95C